MEELCLRFSKVWTYEATLTYNVYFKFMAPSEAEKGFSPK